MLLNQEPSEAHDDIPTEPPENLKFPLVELKVAADVIFALVNVNKLVPEATIDIYMSPSLSRTLNSDTPTKLVAYEPAESIGPVTPSKEKLA